MTRLAVAFARFMLRRLLDRFTTDAIGPVDPKVSLAVDRIVRALDALSELDL